MTFDPMAVRRDIEIAMTRARSAGDGFATNPAEQEQNMADGSGNGNPDRRATLDRDPNPNEGRSTIVNYAIASDGMKSPQRRASLRVMDEEIHPTEILLDVDELAAMDYESAEMYLDRLNVPETRALLQATEIVRQEHRRRLETLDKYETVIRERARLLADYNLDKPVRG